MSPSGRLIVKVSDDLDQLLDDLANVLRESSTSNDPFVVETIVCPNAGVRDYVTSGLADRLGIAANLNFQSLGTFISSVLVDSGGEVNDRTDDWTIENLTWVVYEVLLDVCAGVISGLNVPGLSPVDDQGASAGSLPHRGESLWAIARRIADLFDRYSFQRPTLIESWAGLRAEDPTERSLLQSSHEWQPKLWQVVNERIRTSNPGARNPAQVRRLGLLALREGRLSIAVPPRVTIVGMNAIPSSAYEVLSALATQREVRVYMTHPSKTWWDVTPTKRVLDPVFDDAEIDASTSHPLLRSWGQSSMSASALVKGHSDIDCEWLPSAKRLSGESGELLGHLRESLSRGELHVVPGAVADDSLQLHACHGASRQVEVLREALVRTFVEFDGVDRLEARDVLIVCPDIQRFAPLTEAILGQGALGVSAVLSDRTLSSENHIVSALMAIIEVATGRATVGELVSLIGMEPIRMRFGWSVEEANELADLCVDLGTRWGLNRERRGGPNGLENGTWRWIADQMILGIADDAPVRRRRFKGVPPADGIASTDISMIGSFGLLVSRLEELNDWIFSSFGDSEVATAKPAEQWWEKLRGTLVDLLADLAGATFGHAKLLARFDGLWGSAVTSGVQLTLDDVKSMLASLPDSSPGRLRLRSGKVTVTSMLPSAGVPADVVCILGFDEAASRAPGSDGDDILGNDPRIGDRAGRSENRQLLLDAVRSARRRLIITFDGFDVASNEVLKPVVALQEFVEVVETILPDVTSGSGTIEESARFLSKRKRFGIAHPRHGFEERNFLEGAIDGRARVFSHDPSARLAATVRRGGTDSGRSPVWRLAIGPTATEFSIDELAATLKNPSEVYFRDRLEINLREASDTLEDSLPFEFSNLVRSTLGNELLDVLLGKTPGDEKSWFESSVLHPDCPPGVIGTEALDKLKNEVVGIKDAFDSWTSDSDGKVRKWIDPFDEFEIELFGGSVQSGHENPESENDDPAFTKSTESPTNECVSIAMESSATQTTLNGVDCQVKRIVGSVGNLVSDESTLTLVLARFTRPWNYFYLQTAVRLAALVVDGRWQKDHARIEGRMFVRAKDGDDVQIIVLEPVEEGTVAKAWLFLEVVRTLRCAALQDAVPFFCNLSRKIYDELDSIDQNDPDLVRRALRKIYDTDDELLKLPDNNRYQLRHWPKSDLLRDLSSDNSESAAWAMRVWTAFFDFIKIKTEGVEK